MRNFKWFFLHHSCDCSARIVCAKFQPIWWTISNVKWMDSINVHFQRLENFQNFQHFQQFQEHFQKNKILFIHRFGFGFLSSKATFFTLWNDVVKYAHYKCSLGDFVVVFFSSIFCISPFASIQFGEKLTKRWRKK